MKKNFNQGINSLLLNTREVKEDTPETNVLEDLKDSEGETRATLILNEVVINKFKAISYWDRVPLKVIMDDALSVFLNLYEEKNGKIKPLKA